MPDEQAKTKRFKGGEARMQALTKEQRTEFARSGAKARWKDKEVPVEPAPLPTQPAKSPHRKRRVSKPKQSRNEKVFEQALASAEQEYVIALKDHAEYSGKLALLNMRIPALQRTIAVLRQQQNPSSVAPYMQPYTPQIPAIPQPPTMEQIMSDVPIQPGYQPPQMPVQPVAPGLTTAPVVKLAGGSAMGVELTGTGDDEDDQHLRESGVAGGQWI
jgi:hypothetical protein